MKTDKTLRQDVSRMVEMQMEIEANGGAENRANAKLILDFAMLRQNILDEGFGLPDTTEHGWLCFAKESASEAEIDFIFKRLEFAEVVYKNKNAKKALKALGLPLHTYNLFVYNEILLKKKNSVGNIYNLLMKANEPQTLAYLTSVTTAIEITEKHLEMFEYFRQKEISYVGEYFEPLRAELLERVRLEALLANEKIEARA